MKSAKTILTIATIFGMMAVLIGAFGAHGLNELLVANGRLDTFETAVDYHFYHTFALLVVGVLQMKVPSPYLIRSAWCFAIGIVVFSGSLYTLCISGLGFFGAITPVGGAFFILGWLLVLLAMRRL